MTMMRESSPLHDSIDQGIVDATREFLLTRDEDAAATPNTPVERGAALVLQWSHARARGDHAAADGYARQMAHEQGTNPFPFRQTLAAFQNFYANPAHQSGNAANYRPPQASNPSFGMIDWQLPDDAKVGIIGDFGTGEPDAGFLLDSMLEQHDDLAAILHLGDIYETGSRTQVDDYFIAPLTNAFGKVLSRPGQPRFQIPVYAVPGDHEYFSYGDGFFYMIDKINSALDPKQKQEASFFCLRTKSGSWQILGGDTGFTSDKQNRNDQPSVDPRELAWHKDKLKNFLGKTLFMTHRQFVSGWDPLDGDGYNNALIGDVLDLLPQIHLFLWGHEHRFAPFVDAHQLGIPGFTGKSAAKLRTLGGSGRHPKGGEAPPSYPQHLMKNGNSYFWTGFANGQTNHSYAVLDLGKSQVSYYQTTAWYGDGTGMDRQAPQAPVLVDSL